MKSQLKLTIAAFATAVAASTTPASATSTPTASACEGIYTPEFEQDGRCTDHPEFTFCYVCDPGCVDGREEQICGMTAGPASNCPDEPSCYQEDDR